MKLTIPIHKVQAVDRPATRFVTHHTTRIDPSLPSITAYGSASSATGSPPPLATNEEQPFPLFPLITNPPHSTHHTRPSSQPASHDMSTTDQSLLQLPPPPLTPQQTLALAVAIAAARVRARAIARAKAAAAAAAVGREAEAEAKAEEEEDQAGASTRFALVHTPRP